MEKKKKIPSQLRHKDLPNFYKIVKNTRTGFTKLVPAVKATEMIEGKLEHNKTDWYRIKVLKDNYIESSTAQCSKRDHSNIQENKENKESN